MRRVLIFLFFAIILLGAFAGWYYVTPGPLEQETTVILPRGKGFVAVTEELGATSVIQLPLAFETLAVATGDARKFKAGEYHFSPHVTPREVLAMLVEGRTVIHKLTVAEGLTVAEISALMTAEKALTGDMPTLEEGELLPETYYFSYGDTREEVAGRMKKAMHDTLDGLWAKRAPDLPFTSEKEALTLASIVEKETGVADERGRVAAVFINRLKKGIPLQSDPTVSYGIEKQTGKKLERPLTTKDLETPTPYNTYVIPTLPPGPIANPGKATLAATLNPPQTDELYFVATGTGGHNFSRTVEEHNKNVVKYRAMPKTEKNKK